MHRLVALRSQPLTEKVEQLLSTSAYCKSQAEVGSIIRSRFQPYPGFSLDRPERTEANAFVNLSPFLVGFIGIDVSTANYGRLTSCLH